MALSKSGFGSSLLGFFKATIVGGALFLLPVVLIVIVLGHAMQLAVKQQSRFRIFFPWKPWSAFGEKLSLQYWSWSSSR
jgi:hypothetical protein